MKVTNTKYKVATLIITILMLENVYMHQIVFTNARKCVHASNCFYNHD